MKKDPRVRLLHIRDAILSIEEYTRGGKPTFLEDERTQDAVIYNMAIIGEAVKKLPKVIRDDHADVPWKKIAGMRDIVIHDYDDTNLQEIWSAVEHDVPTLKKTIEHMLAQKAA